VTAAALGRSEAAPGTTLAVTLTDEYVMVVQKPVRVGQVTFKVVNKSSLARDFRIGGKKTPRIAPGKAATLAVAFTKTGLVVYSSAAVRGAPLTGVLTFVDPCTASRRSEVSVQMSEAPPKLSATSIPCGTVTFMVTNTGTIAHSFRVANRQTAQLQPGQSATLTVSLLSKGRTYIVCGELEHDELYGESGWLGVR
jgi:uncharacterized cupredoxin-like copper-binding protein